MTDYELYELIYETSEEFEQYCEDKQCRAKECLILRNFPGIDCPITYVAHKLNVIDKAGTLHDLVNNYCNLFVCGQCNIKNYKDEHPELEDTNCFLISAIIHECKRFDLL